MSIVLIGYRGSGKSTVGRLLAGRLGLPFADSDDLIVARAGKTIADIFAQQGEAAFRELEGQIVGELSRSLRQVIALGGGSLLRETNRLHFAGPHHTVVYLRCQAEELHRRIHADPQTAHARPSLSALGGSLQEVRVMLAQRESAYVAAMTFAVDVDCAAPAQIADEIISHLSESTGKTT